MHTLTWQETEVVCTRGTRWKQLRHSSRYIPANVSPLGIPEWRDTQAPELRQQLAFAGSTGQAFHLNLRHAALEIRSGEHFVSTKLINQGGTVVFWTLRSVERGNTIRLVDRLRQEAASRYPVFRYFVLGGVATYSVVSHFAGALLYGVVCIVSAAIIPVIIRRKVAAKALETKWRGR